MGHPKASSSNLCSTNLGRGKIVERVIDYHTHTHSHNFTAIHIQAVPALLLYKYIPKKCRHAKNEICTVCDDWSEFDGETFFQSQHSLFSRYFSMPAHIYESSILRTNISSVFHRIPLELYLNEMKCDKSTVLKSEHSVEKQHESRMCNGAAFSLISQVFSHR